ncbi:MAG TPA: ComEC/Rec2 family competence protein [Burkholderiales bacterium]|nr:ComEC/Rec2 family competence protein [Burkholderiales bacterium]
MLSYLCISLGIISAQFIHLPRLIAIIILICCASTYCWLRFKSPLANPQYQRILVWFVLFISCLAYADLRISARLAEVIKEPISQLTVKAHLIAPIQDKNSHLQSQIQIDSGSFKGQNMLLFFQPNTTLLPQYQYQLTLNIRPLNIPANFYAFNYQQYLVAQNITANASLVGHPQLQKTSYTPSALINTQRVNLINYLQKTLADKQYAGLVIALVTGYQNLIPTDQWGVFKNSGITHIVSISGLHITLVAGMFVLLINFLLKLLPPTRTPRQIILVWAGVLAALAYSLLAGFTIPTQRTFYQLLVMAYLLSRRSYLPLINKLGLTLVVVLLMDPFASFSIGFWFSFIIVATIFIVISNYARISSKLALWIRMHCFITLVSVPLSLFLFACFPPISFVANLWAIPVIGNIMTPVIVVASLFHFSWIIILCADILNYAMLPIEYLAKIQPYHQQTPNLVVVILAYLGIILLLTPRSLAGKNILGAVLFTSLFFVDNRADLSYGELQINAFANSKSGYVIAQTQNHNLLIIAGNDADKTSQQLPMTVLPYLNSQNIQQIDYLIANQSESEIKAILEHNQIHVIDTKLEQDSSLDGVEIENTASENQIALRLRERSGNLSYIGSGYQPYNDQNWQNIVIAYPLSPLKWLYQIHANNLLLNYPQEQSRSIHGLTDNINLDVKNIYDLPQDGSVILRNNSIKTIKSE